MIALEPNVDRARVIALRLHALHEDDRQWLLDKVPPEARAGLEALVAELRQLGFPALQELRVAAEPRTTDAEGDPDSDAPAIVDGATSQQVWDCLRSEPESIRNCLLSFRRWRWYETLAREQYIALGAAKAAPPENVTSRTCLALTRALANRLSAERSVQVSRDGEGRLTAYVPQRSLPERIGASLKRSFSWLR